MSAKKIDTALFKAVFKLFSSKPWLEQRDEQVFELLNDCETERQQTLILDLLQRFKISTSSDLSESARLIMEKVTVDWQLPPESTIIVAVADKNESDGSHFLLKALAQKFSRNAGWGAANFCGHITGVADLTENFVNVVLIDDFIGSGKKIAKKMKWVRSTLGEITNVKKIYVCSMAGMELAKTLLDGLDADYFSTIWLSKGITDFYVGDQLLAAMEDMKMLESTLTELNPDYSFGYKKCQALYYHEPYNVSNNVFPLFWWEKSERRKFRKVLLSRGAA
ncbi:MAG: hypothetical protein V4495_10995 [Pseudomonadota bacterium]